MLRKEGQESFHYSNTEYIIITKHQLTTKKLVDHVYIITSQSVPPWENGEDDEEEDLLKNSIQSEMASL